jgi:outer membrane receptor protein involved in Fe transport
MRKYWLATLYRRSMRPNTSSSSQISLADVEAIEIYRGTTPINFARASIGGAINIRTLRDTGKRQLNSKAGLGSLGTRQIGASYLERKSHWGVVAAALLHALTAALDSGDRPLFHGRVLMLSSLESVMAFGRDTYLHNILTRFGGKNAFGYC